MEVYNQIKKDLETLVTLIVIVAVILNSFDYGVDSTDGDGWNRSGFTLLKDYGTGKEYLYRDGVIIERGK